jgi:transposase
MAHSFFLAGLVLEIDPQTKYKPIAGLQIRHWACSSCGESHDRDINAARNILCVGAERRPPGVEIRVLDGAKDVNAVGVNSP